ncbi:DUF5686 and carboxypeptidase regulatory-like domain-containing protein [uncultured Flavobacterium sp.]|uniref:DUF5686 and carboxypeptidase regulatory-like domain-containing protein n=1 Tax=uncultured Flavobacterium sp. TaxID=165435 RepID=UPI0030CA13EE
MNNNLYTLILCFFSISFFAQIKGSITDNKGQPLAFVSVYIENTYTGTTSNENGNYELNYSDKKNITLIYQYLGYKTQKKTISTDTFPVISNVTLLEESYNLTEIVLTNGENPANQIIRNVLKFKKINSSKTDKFEADFYSRGIFRVKNLPKKIMGQQIGDMDGDIDSLTRSGVIYLSETVSKIKVQKPDKLKEIIVASKTAGDSKGFSYNTALNTNYDFYENYVDFDFNMVSPIADNAFNYYKFKLESTFYDDNNNLINKILVTPKRDKEPVFEGYIFIVEDSWAIYGVDLDIKGYRMQEPILENMKLQQNFSFNKVTNLWVKNVQSLDFSAGIFGIGFTGKFTHVFSNYVFKEEFASKTFGKEVISFEEKANKKEDSYWTSNRQVPLSNEETVTYVRKDSISKLRNSKPFLDSLDTKNNKFKLFDLINGYTFKNSFKNWSLSYKGISDIMSTSFNTVQGYNFNTGFSFSRSNDDNGKKTFINSNFNYGLSDDKLRVSGSFNHRFNLQNFASFSISGGVDVAQFNNEEPISKFLNSISTLFFKNNFIKIYEKKFAQVSYGQEVTNGLYMSTGLIYEKRKSVFNTTNYTLIKKDDVYTSNDPLQPLNNTSAPFNEHHIIKGQVSARVRFGQKYISRPDRKITLQDADFPTLYFNYQKAFSASNENYKYDFISASITYNKTLSNKGSFRSMIHAGMFFNADQISFVDYKHFNGNQTHINIDRKINSFSILPYYTSSTNDGFIETHLDHNFKGFIMNKIPLLNKLQWNLVSGFHQLNVPNYKPYQEFNVGFDNIGFGKFRILRIDYVRSYQNGYQGDGFMFGLKF